MLRDFATCTIRRWFAISVLVVVGGGTAPAQAPDVTNRIERLFSKAQELESSARYVEAARVVGAVVACGTRLRTRPPGHKRDRDSSRAPWRRPLSSGRTSAVWTSWCRLAARSFPRGMSVRCRRETDGVIERVSAREGATVRRARCSSSWTHATCACARHN